MTQRTFIFEKLIRGHLPELMRQKGMTVLTRPLEHEEVGVKLKEKPKEEAQEVYGTHTPEEVTQELADVIEVVKALASYHNVSFEQVLQVAQAKKNEKGGFDRAAYVTRISIPQDHPSVSYYTSRPEHYPEVKSIS